MWVPRTTVYMQNYLPWIARFGPFSRVLESDPELLFSFGKNLEPREDVMKVDGREVFVYEWREEGFKFVVDVDS